VPSRLVKFGTFELDSASGELRKHGIKIRLQDQPLQILHRLLESPGEVVTREELRKRIWPADTFVDFDHGLYSAVQRLRDALGDTAETPRYIETLPRRGYRFIAAVNNGSHEKQEPARVEAPAFAAPERLTPRRTWLTPILGITGALIVAFLLALAFKSERFLGRPTVPAIQSLAVLPLANLSSDPAQEYLADGMTDALITDLAQIGSLKVISRTSTLRYKKIDKPLPEIARELNVAGIVEGTVQRSGDRVRITAQLIYGPKDLHLWAKSYERNLRDVLTLQSEVAGAIANEIQAKLTPQEQVRLQTPRSVNLQAHELYLQGNYFLSLPRGCEKAVGLFLRAIQTEPTAPGYIGLARAYECLDLDSPPKEVLPKAQAAVLQALRIDETSSDAHRVLAQTKLVLDWDWPGAEKEFRRAIELNPNSSEAHLGFALFLDGMGRLDEGEQEHLRAQEVDPFNERMNETFYHTRQYDRAIDVLRNQIDRTPEDAGAHWQLGIIYDQRGRSDEAIAEWERMFEVSGYEPEYGFAEALRRGHARAGHKGALLELTRKLEEVSRQRYVPSDLMALFYESLGERDKSFAWLQKAFEQHNTEIPGLKTDLMWDGLRSDPRFIELVRRVGLPQ
jgi:TolB-like protein/DNA-binding winged helix-turn-helix (wHTH) protein